MTPLPPLPPVDEVVPRIEPPRSLAEFADRYRLSRSALLALFEMPGLAGEIDATGALSHGAWIKAARIAPAGIAHRIAAAELVNLGEELARIGRLVGRLIEDDQTGVLAPLFDRIFLGAQFLAFTVTELCWLGAGAPDDSVLDAIWKRRPEDPRPGGAT